MSTTPLAPARWDDRVRLHDVSWEDYERILAIRGDRSAPRISYLGVGEVWYWEDDAITVNVLDGDHYRQAPASTVLPDLDLEQLASFLNRPTTSDAIRDYRDALGHAG